MASPAELSAPERAYREIRTRLLHGGFRFGQRLDSAAIADELKTSTTPVREALIRLSAERLVAMRQAQGFFVVLWSEPGLKALYLWRGALARLAVEAAGGVFTQPLPMASYPLRVAAILSGFNGVNPEITRAAGNADDRLFRARMSEQDLWKGAENELETLARVFAEGKARKSIQALRAYHNRRAQAAPALRDRAVLNDLPDNGA